MVAKEPREIPRTRRVQCMLARGSSRRVARLAGTHRDSLCKVDHISQFVGEDYHDAKDEYSLQLAVKRRAAWWNAPCTHAACPGKACPTVVP